MNGVQGMPQQTDMTPVHFRQCQLSCPVSVLRPFEELELIWVSDDLTLPRSYSQSLIYRFLDISLLFIPPFLTYPSLPCLSLIQTWILNSMIYVLYTTLLFLLLNMTIASSTLRLLVKVIKVVFVSVQLTLWMMNDWHRSEGVVLHYWFNQGRTLLTWNEMTRGHSSNQTFKKLK